MDYLVGGEAPTVCMHSTVESEGEADVTEWNIIE